MIAKVTVIQSQNKSLGEGIQEFWEYRELLYTWTRQQSELLRQREFNQLDLSHLIEEIVDLGNRYYDQLESRFMQLIAHLLKWQVEHWLHLHICHRTLSLPDSALSHQ